MYIYIHIHVYIYISIYTCAVVCLSDSEAAWEESLSHIYVCIHTHIYIYTCANIYIYTFLDTCSGLFVRLWSLHEGKVSRTYMYVYMQIHICMYAGWQWPIGCLKLQVIFRKRATNQALLRKMTYKDKGSYGSSPPCIWTSGMFVRIWSCVRVKATHGGD